VKVTKVVAHGTKGENGMMMKKASCPEPRKRASHSDALRQMLFIMAQERLRDRQASTEIA
jgi:hypothetical protein